MSFGRNGGVFVRILEKSRVFYSLSPLMVSCFLISDARIALFGSFRWLAKRIRDTFHKAMQL